MGKVFLVTSGAYSDYSIRAAFSTREKAQNYMDRFISIIADAGIEEWDLDPIPDEYYQKDKFWWKVATHSRGRYSVEAMGFDEEPSPDFIKGRVFDMFLSDDLMIAYHIEAKDERSAAKIAMEKRAQYIALKDGIQSD